MKSPYKSPSKINRKTKRKAYQFWYLFGSHYAYLGKWVSQISLWTLLLAWLPVVILPNVEFFQQYLGIFAFGLPFVGIFILFSDLLFIPYYVQKFNERMYEAIKKAKEEKEEEVLETEQTGDIGYPITY